jgi:hypothetical protein
MKTRLKFVGGLATVSAVAVAAVVPAGAQASSCLPGDLTKPFVPWLDFKWYTSAPNGGFEQGDVDWRLAGGAHLTWGNEPFYASSTLDHTSLALPGGATATSAPVCVTLDHPTVRFFAVNTGDPASRLNVSISFRRLNGQVSSVDIGQVAGGSNWAPTPVVAVTANLLRMASDGQVAFRFAPADPLGNWWIDDVYIDPYGKR